MVDLSWVAPLLPLVAAGFGVGMLVGLTGVGGGALMTPLLISSFGVSPQVAVGTDLLYASITKTAGSWRHHVSRHVEWPIVLRLAAGSLPAAAGLLAAITFLPIDTVKLAHWIRMGLVGALPLSALAIVLYPWLTRSSPPEDHVIVPQRTLPTVLFGVISPQSPLQNLATAPEFIWEAFLGLWLTFKGFKRVALNAGETPDVRAAVGASVDATVAA